MLYITLLIPCIAAFPFAENYQNVLQHLHSFGQRFMLQRCKQDLTFERMIQSQTALKLEELRYELDVEKARHSDVSEALENVYGDREELRYELDVEKAKHARASEALENVFGERE